MNLVGICCPFIGELTKTAAPFESAINFVNGLKKFRCILWFHIISYVILTLFIFGQNVANLSLFAFDCLNTLKLFFFFFTKLNGC